LPVEVASGGVRALVVDKPVIHASWRQGWLRPGAAVIVTGSVGAPSTLTAALRPFARPGFVSARADFEIVRAGAFSEKLRLPPRPLPGRYRLSIGGKSGTTELKTVEIVVTIPAPPEGVLDRTEVGTTANGPWLLYRGQSPPVVHGSHKELWMRFRFLSPPSGRHIEIVWKMSWHTIVGKVSKGYADTLDTFCSSATTLPSGRWTVVLTIDGRVAKQMDVLLR
jgi:hypothetical protein